MQLNWIFYKNYVVNRGTVCALVLIIYSYSEEVKEYETKYFTT